MPVFDPVVDVPDWVHGLPLVFLFSPEVGQAEEMLVIERLWDERLLLNGRGPSFKLSLLAYECGLRKLALPSGSAFVYAATSDGRPLPGTDLLFEGEVRDSEFLGWQALSRPSKTMLEARIERGTTSPPYPDCFMGTILDVAARGLTTGTLP